MSKTTKKLFLVIVGVVVIAAGVVVLVDKPQYPILILDNPDFVKLAKSYNELLNEIGKWPSIVKSRPVKGTGSLEGYDFYFDPYHIGGEYFFVHVYKSGNTDDKLFTMSYRLVAGQEDDVNKVTLREFLGVGEDERPFTDGQIKQVSDMYTSYLQESVPWLKANRESLKILGTLCSETNHELQKKLKEAMDLISKQVPELPIEKEYSFGNLKSKEFQGITYRILYSYWASDENFLVKWKRANEPITLTDWTEDSYTPIRYLILTFQGEKSGEDGLVFTTKLPAFSVDGADIKLYIGEPIPDSTKKVANMVTDAVKLTHARLDETIPKLRAKKGVMSKEDKEELIKRYDEAKRKYDEAMKGVEEGSKEAKKAKKEYSESWIKFTRGFVEDMLSD